MTFTNFLDYCESYGVCKVFLVLSETQGKTQRLDYGLTLVDALRLQKDMLCMIEINREPWDTCDIYELDIATARRTIEDRGDCGFTFENARIAFDKSIDVYAFVERLEQYHFGYDK